MQLAAWSREKPLMSSTGDGSAVDDADARARDSTAGPACQSALLETEIFRNAILNSADFAVISTDARGIIQLFNVGAVRMLGYAADDVVNRKTLDALFDPQQPIDHAKALSTEFATTIAPGLGALAFEIERGTKGRHDLDYVRKDGSRFPAQVSITVLRDDEAEIIGYLIIANDNSTAQF